MKYAVELRIAVPRAQVLELFADRDNDTRWQPGLKQVELLEGEADAVGARRRLTYRIGQDEIVMEEELEEWALPDSVTAVYTAPGVWNRCRNEFVPTDDGATRWIQHNEFRMKGFSGIMAAIFPGSFRKQTEKDMRRFKEFAEGQR